MTGIAEGRYRDLVELSLDGILLHSEGRIAFANAAAHRMLGSEPGGTIVGRLIDDFMPPPYLPVVQAELVAPGTGATPYVERQVARLDGSALDVEVSAVPFVFMDRPSVQVVLRDIGERVRQRAAGTLAESQFKLLAEQMPFVIWTADVERRVLTVAGDLTSPFGRQAQAALAAQGELALLRDAVDAIDDGAEAPLPNDCEVDGRHYALRIERRRGPAGVDIGILGVAFDMTPWLRIQELLREGSRVDAMEQIAGGVAHEVNNVLAIIAGSAMLIEQRSVTGEAAVIETVREIIAATKRAAETTQSLLAFAMRGIHLPGSTSIDALTRTVVETLRRASPPHIVIERSSSARAAEVVGDESRLVRALLNVCWNAIDAMPRGGRLRIQTSDVDDVPGDGAWVRIAVSDTGVGMSESVVEHAFEPFFTEFASGCHVGLGLSMTQGVVKQHGGRITLASRLGHGTTVTIELPVARPSGPGLAAATTPAEGDASRADVSMRPKVLVVDDEAILRKVSGRLLAKLGYTSVEAADGLDALALFAEAPTAFAFVLIDVVMPDMSGVDVLDRLRRIDPQVRAIIYSGFPRDDRTAAACASLNVGYLAKPFAREDLAALVDRVTARVAPA